MLPPRSDEPAPTLLLLAQTAEGTLMTEPYCRLGRLLHARGWNVASLDLPCHGSDARAGEPAELVGWAHRAAAGEDVVADFRRRVGEVVDDLVARGLADPARLAAAGTSRGGFLALHAAAGDPRIRSVAAFAPATDLLALREFSGQETSPLVRRLSLLHAAAALADRWAWMIIGHDDDRVGTDRAVALARAISAAAADAGTTPRVTLHVAPVPGHRSLAEWHDQAAEWLYQRQRSRE